MNYEKLINTLTAPKLWERSEAAFWDDEHISEQMLAAHLDPNIDAASRKLETIEKSVEWLSNIIEKNSKILNLGCGPGLYAKKLSDLGYDVTGVDYSHNSIEYAKNHDSKTKYRYQNYLELTDKAAYDDICGNKYTGLADTLCFVVEKAAFS